MRLDKFIAKSTLLSKQQILQHIQEQHVLVNDRFVSDASHQVHQNNTVKLEGEVLTLRPFRYLLIHKPTQTICSNIDEVYPSVLNILWQSQSIQRQNETLTHVNELHIAGRLDADTTGLILVTDDGNWTYNITLPTNHCPKVYRVGLSRPIADDKHDDIINDFAKGLKLQGEDKLTRPAKLVILSQKEVVLTITEGKFHQVKRMFAAVGNRVKTLHREQIGEVKLDVKEGGWRYLTPQEISSFFTLNAIN